MTTEKALENILRIADEIKSGANAVALISCEKFITELKAEIHARATAQKAAQNGQKDILAGALKILQSVKRKHNPIFTKALRTANGEQIVTDGFRAVKFFEPLDLPEPDITERYNAENMAAGIDQLIIQASGNRGETVTPQSVDELKNFIAVQKATMKAKGDKSKMVLLDITPKVRVDACLLVDLLRALPGATITMSANKIEPWRRPIFLKAENGCGILLPLFKGDDNGKA